MLHAPADNSLRVLLTFDGASRSRDNALHGRHFVCRRSFLRQSTAAILFAAGASSDRVWPPFCLLTEPPQTWHFVDWPPGFCLCQNCLQPKASSSRQATRLASRLLPVPNLVYRPQPASIGCLLWSGLLASACARI